MHLRSIKQGLKAVIGAALLTALAPLVAYAQTQVSSGFGCRALEHNRALPAVEGKDGFFFAINPELMSHHTLSDAMVREIAALSEVLRTKGTALVLLPVPTRAMALIDKLTPLARGIGYDPEQAVAVHQEMLKRLRAARIITADAFPQLRQAALDGNAPFLNTDPRPTPAGARILAQSVGAAVVSAGLKGVGQFQSVMVNQTVIPSHMRAILQMACHSELPRTEVTSFVTVDSASQSGEISEHLVVLGTETTATKELNFAGFVGESTGYSVKSYGVPNGGAFAAMASYLTSNDYATAAPKVLVWEWPVSSSMGAHGLQPIRELSAAAARACKNKIPFMNRDDKLVADINWIAKDRPLVLEFDTGGVPAIRASFHFIDAEGVTKSRSIYREPNQVLTGRFYFSPVDPVAAHAVSLEVETGQPLGFAPSLKACE
ncbi:MAG: hypothetical protein MK098_08825 [Marinovum sp.]|nr:hypothetical protein [Marinovum sp.]